MLNKPNKQIPPEYEGKEGREVRISLTNGSTAKLGVFHSYDDSHIYLKPSLIEEGIYNQDKEYIVFVNFETETSTSIRRDLVSVMEPLSEGYLEKLVNSLNQSKRNIILP